MDINLEVLSYIYRSGTPFADHAVVDVSLSIPHGTLQAIVGRTGSGKSTLIQLIAGLLRPTMGSIRVGEHLITAKTKKIPFR
jgi:energy-coupling factor transport system ATP-binding protein